MEKSISSIPGAKFFRSNFALIIIVILIGLYFNYNQDLTNKANDIAKKQVIININNSLAMMLYSYTIKGEQNELQKFHQKNPFVPLAIYRETPSNYIGTNTLQNALDHQWFFDQNKNMLVYKEGENINYWQMVYVQESGVGRLVIKEVNN